MIAPLLNASSAQILQEADQGDAEVTPTVCRYTQAKAITAMKAEACRLAAHKDSLRRELAQESYRWTATEVCRALTFHQSTCHSLITVWVRPFQQIMFIHSLSTAGHCLPPSGACTVSHVYILRQSELSLHAKQPSLTSPAC